jgi:hypothetical protein
VAVEFQVDLTDAPRTFAIQLSNGYAAAGTVTGGHTRIKPCGDEEDGEDDEGDEGQDGPSPSNHP